MRLALMLSLLVTLLRPISGYCQPHDDGLTRRPWQWADDERIAARLDPAFVANHAKKEGQTGKMTFTIDGRENPQLLLPYELFNWLMRGVTDPPESRATLRAMLSDRLASFGYHDPNAFWAELETVVAPHAALVRRNAALTNELQTSARSRRDEVAREIESANIPLCRSRAAALSAARAHFGRDTFDRLLYTVVAAHLSVASPLPSKDEARGLAYVEGGCR